MLKADTMGTLFDRLTLKHFARGWPIFWRMNLPHWVSLLHLGASIAAAFRLEDILADGPLRRWPAALDSPLWTTAVLSVALFLALWFPVRWLQRGLRRRSDADFWKSQFALLGGLGALSRGIATLLGVLALLFLLGNDGVLAGGSWLKTLFFLFALVLVAVLSVIVGLYGWLAAQWSELKTEKTP